MPRIFLLEDELSHQLLIQKALGEEYQLVIASDFSEGLRLIHEQSFDLFILDINLGSASGFEFCNQLRLVPGLKTKPIIFLSSRSDIDSKITGFNLGADDYLVKPCEPVELRARIQAKLRRVADMSLHSQSFEEGGFCFHLDRQIVEVVEEGQKREIDLTPLEFKLFSFLARHKNEAQSRDKILSHVWGQGTNVLDRSVDTYIASLRRKLSPHGKCLKSVHGLGYKFSEIKSKTGRAA